MAVDLRLPNWMDGSRRGSVQQMLDAHGTNGPGGHQVPLVAVPACGQAFHAGCREHRIEDHATTARKDILVCERPVRKVFLEDGLRTPWDQTWAWDRISQLFRL